MSGSAHAALPSTTSGGASSKPPDVAAKDRYVLQTAPTQEPTAGRHCTGTNRYVASDTAGQNAVPTFQAGQTDDAIASPTSRPRMNASDPKDSDRKHGAMVTRASTFVNTVLAAVPGSCLSMKASKRCDVGPDSTR